jgi:hypothetical protein
VSGLFPIIIGFANCYRCVAAFRPLCSFVVRTKEEEHQARSRRQINWNDLLFDTVLFQGVLQSAYGGFALSGERASSDDRALAQESTGGSGGNSDHCIVVSMFYRFMECKDMNLLYCIVFRDYELQRTGMKE